MLYFSGFYNDDESFNYFLPKSLMKIQNDGMVTYSHDINLNSYCSANLMKWPFDSHKCTFYIGSPIFKKALVNFSFPDGYYASIDLLFYLL